MNRLLNFFRSTRPARRPQSARLNVETLEDRMVLSPSSTSLHAVQDITGASAAFFHGPKDNAFYEKTPSGAIVQLSGTNTVSDFSAGLDVNGHADVFAHLYGSMYEHDDAGWHWLNEPIPMLQFAAVKGGRCYAEGNDNSLWEYTPPTTVTYYINWGGRQVPVTTTIGGWQKLWAANAVWNVDAVTQSSGKDMVFAVGGDRRLERFDPQFSDWQTLAAGSTWRCFSAGLDGNGNANVWMITNSGDLDRWTNGPNGTGYWQYFLNLSGVSDVVGVSATTNGQVFVFQYSGGGVGDDYIVSKFDTEHPTGRIISYSNNAGMVAAGFNDLFVMTTDGHLQEYVGDNVWRQWT